MPRLRGRGDSPGFDAGGYLQERILRREDLLTYCLNSLGLPLKKIGGEHKGPCPLCGEGDDRFWVYGDGLAWGCRKCERKGSIYDLVAYIEKRDVKEVLRETGRGTFVQSGQAPLVQGARNSGPREISGDFLTDEWQTAAKSIITKAELELARHESARDYLTGRAIDRETQKAFRIGYDPKPSAIVIPYLGRDLAVSCVRYRRLHPESPKHRFFNLKGGRPFLFGAHLAQRTPQCVIVEGEVNAMSVYQSLRGALDVFSFGNESMKSGLAKMSALYSRILFWLDDPKKLATACKEHGAANVVYMASPEGCDANDLLVNHGERVLATLVRRRLGG